MKLRLLIPGAVLIALAAGAACGDGGLSLEDALRRMVLQPDQLPEGLEMRDETFTTNEDVAASAPDREERLELLASWERLLGYEIAYRRAPDAPSDLPAQGINVSASLYATSSGASDSFADAVRTAQETDWEMTYSGLRDFRQDEIERTGLADELVWLRLSGFQTTSGVRDELVTDDLIFFRTDRERGFLRVLTSTGDTDDRAHYEEAVEAWLSTLVGNVTETLPQLEEGG